MLEGVAKLAKEYSLEDLEGKLTDSNKWASIRIPELGDLNYKPMSINHLAHPSF
jgi:hypothetical protein